MVQLQYFRSSSAPDVIYASVVRLSKMDGVFIFERKMRIETNGLRKFIRHRGFMFSVNGIIEIQYIDISSRMTLGTIKLFNSGLLPTGYHVGMHLIVAGSALQFLPITGRVVFQHIGPTLRLSRLRGRTGAFAIHDPRVPDFVANQLAGNTVIATMGT